ncbi:MAG: right-handed parallel beta-helix repeat-containing protein [Bacteroidales bacterium]|nr:right-handed parallel beta-helix repeat-containing protein [Bacteroidales bacterium]
MTLALLFTVAVASAKDIHVATTGSDTAEGTEEAPLLTIHKAVEMVEAGDRILIHEGTYTISERIKIPALATSAERRCEMRAWPEEAVGKVIIDGSAMNHTAMADFKMGRCIYVNHLANYWTFYGLTLQNAEDNGMKVEGSYNVIERCVFRWNNDTGLQIGMYKDFSIEETKSLPISGTPQFNPGYTYCRYNKVVNCDSYENYDSRSYNGTDDGGDADGFACKLFPGPGTEFHGCRAWTNSDDNWDLYMVYHPVVIDHCWAWHAGYTPEGKAVGNGNGFKLGGGGSSGGAAFDQSVGAHVVTNCVAFDNHAKGFDQNNAYEGMYVINCVAWGNGYNYRFPTVFKYGGMTIRNCIGWGAVNQNHEFLSADKSDSQVPDTDYNSWTTLDGCNPYKEGQKVADGSKPVTKDYSGEFLSLGVADFQADRQADGSLPDNNFARLKPGSLFKDLGMPVIGYTPARKMTEAECTAAGLEHITADDLYIAYNDEAPDFGAFELDGVPASYTVPGKITLGCTTANSVQEIVEGQTIEDIVYEWDSVGTYAVVEGLSEGLTCVISGNQLTISGTPVKGCTFVITVSGNADEGVKPVSVTGIISLVKPFRVLTGDWYHFQDAPDMLPADLKDVVTVVTSDASYPSRIDPNYTESNNVIPGGCTRGAFVMGRNSGGIGWRFDQGVLQLLVNLHITGGRTFKVNYTMADGSTGSVNIAKIAKGTYCNWNVLEQAGLLEKGPDIRSLSLLNNNSSGEARIYDMYVRVPDSGQSPAGLVGTVRRETVKTRKVLQDGQLIIWHNGVKYNILGREIK